MKRVAIVVAVDRCEDEDIVELRYARSDAREFFGFFKYQAGYDEVHDLIDRSPKDVLRIVQSVARELSPGDLLLFFFAGHGVECDGQMLLLGPGATSCGIEEKQECIPVKLLRRLTDQPGVGRLFILDACRHDLQRSRRTESRRWTGSSALRDIVATPGRHQAGGLTVLCSCAEGMRAREIGALQHGLFSHALLAEFLENHRSGQCPQVDSAFVDRLRSRMIATSLAHDIHEDQCPWIQSSGTLPPVFVPSAGGPSHPVIQSVQAARRTHAWKWFMATLAIGFTVVAAIAWRQPIERGLVRLWTSLPTNPPPPTPPPTRSDEDPSTNRDLTQQPSPPPDAIPTPIPIRSVESGSTPPPSNSASAAGPISLPVPSVTLSVVDPRLPPEGTQEDPPSQDPPHIIVTPAQRDLIVGESLRLELRSLKDPKESVRWSRNGKVLASTRGLAWELTSVGTNDSGTYEALVQRGTRSLSVATAQVVVRPLRPHAGRPWTNAVGMVFVQVPGSSVWFATTEASVGHVRLLLERLPSERQAHLKTTPRSYRYQNRSPDDAPFKANWDEAAAIAEELTRAERSWGWLTEKQAYRLPHTNEWIQAAARRVAREPTSGATISCRP